MCKNASNNCGFVIFAKKDYGLFWCAPSTHNLSELDILLLCIWLIHHERHCLLNIDDCNVNVLDIVVEDFVCLKCGTDLCKNCKERNNGKLIATT
jgi:hypothetical protein